MQVVLRLLCVSSPFLRRHDNKILRQEADMTVKMIDWKEPHEESVAVLTVSFGVAEKKILLTTIYSFE